MNERFMKAALRQAQIALKQDEVPIGAVVVKNGEIVARAHNTRNKSKNAVEHAEITAIRRACKKLGDWRLTGCSLYVTLEPCVMCLGACYNARIADIWFGAYDLSGNGCSLISDTLERTLNHSLFLHGGLLKQQCSSLLTDYFKSKRLG